MAVTALSCKAFLTTLCLISSATDWLSSPTLPTLYGFRNVLWMSRETGVPMLHGLKYTPFS